MKEHSRRAVRWAGSALGLALVLGITSTLSANHPVLVEGERDFDGDQLIGTAEDTDGDAVFGTLNGAMGAATGAANHNARVVVVTTGRFQESVTITGANGNVTLEAQPGIEANIDAVKFGSPANAGAQTVPGIIVDAPGNRRITLRNLVIRNWTDGVQVRNASHLFVDDCRIENNINHGIVFMGSSRGFVNDTEVTATGFRVSPVATGTPNPGVGIRFLDASSGKIANSEVSGSAAAGISDESSRGVFTFNVVTADNNRPPSGLTGTQSSSLE
jgi:hypothetical protein